MGSKKDEIVVLGYWCSSYAMRVKIALEEKGVEYVVKEEDLGNKSPLLIQMNPIHKMIPVLIHNGNPISESLVILQYIDEVWPTPSPLLPSDLPYLRSRAQFWAGFIDKKIYGGAKVLWKAKGKEQEEIKREFIESLKILEKELKDEPFFGGESFGYIDVVLVPITSWFYALEKCGNFSIDSHCPKIIEWANRCQERDSVAKSLPDPLKIYDFVLDLKKRLGLE